MKVKRNEKIYNVIEYLPEQNKVCVENLFDFGYKPYRKVLKMWLSLEDCEIIEDTE